MSALTSQTLISPTESLFMYKTDSLNISTLNASTITTDTIAVFPNAQASASIAGAGATGIQYFQTTGDGAANNQIVLDTADKSLLIGLPGSQSGAYMDYTYQTRNVGTIAILPGGGVGQGGVLMSDETNSALSINGGNMVFNTTVGGGKFEVQAQQSDTIEVIELTSVSSINGVVYPPQSYPPFVPVTFSPGFTPGNVGTVDSNGVATTIASFNTTVGETYRVTMNPTFNNNAVPAAGDNLLIYGSGGLGPDDTIDFVSLNLNWCGSGLNPGLTQAFGQGVSGIMTACNASYTIYGQTNSGCAVTTQVSFGNTNPIVVEKLS